jgi:hypothetical protein
VSRVNNVAAYIDGQPAQVIAYQGLAPIPSGVRTGNVDLEIATVDADNVQATIPIGR